MTTKDTFLKIKDYLTPTTWLILLFLSYFIIKQRQENELNKAYYHEQVKLTKALLAEMEVTKLENGELKYSKLTLQSSVKDLKNLNDVLNDNQKKLLKVVEKNNNLFAAAIIQGGIIGKDIVNDNAAITDSTVSFETKSDTMNYKLSVNNVKPLEKLKPFLTIKELSFPNEQTIEFQWLDNKKEGYPASFSIRNTNSMYKINNIENYVIPEIQKPILKPTVPQKIGKFILNNWKPFAGGLLVGSGGYLYLNGKR